METPLHRYFYVTVADRSAVAVIFPKSLKVAMLEDEPLKIFPVLEKLQNDSVNVMPTHKKGQNIKPKFARHQQVKKNDKKQMSDWRVHLNFYERCDENQQRLKDTMLKYETMRDVLSYHKLMTKHRIKFSNQTAPIQSYLYCVRPWQRKLEQNKVKKCETTMLSSLS